MLFEVFGFPKQSIRALSAFGEGPMGFSLDASFTESLMPISLSS
jgi:hypothetical protein